MVRTADGGGCDVNQWLKCEPVSSEEWVEGRDRAKVPAEYMEPAAGGSEGADTTPTLLVWRERGEKGVWESKRDGDARE